MTTTQQQIDVLHLLDSEPVPLVEAEHDIEDASQIRHFGAAEPHDAEDVLEGVAVTDDADS